MGHPFPIDVLLEQVPIPAALSRLAYGEDLADGSKGLRSQDPKILHLSLLVSEFTQTHSRLGLYLIVPLLDIDKLFPSQGIHKSLDRSLQRSHSSTPGYFCV